MYNNVDNSEKIYLYDVHQGRYVRMFPTRLDALKFLASNQEELTWKDEVANPYLDHINMGSDKENQTIPRTYFDKDNTLRFYYDIQMIDRQYIFVDGLDRIVDFRVYADEINYLYENGIVKYESYPKKKLKAKWKKYDVSYKLRSGPVPYTGKRYGSKPYRMPKLHNLYKHVSVVEYEGFVRSKRNLNNLPNVYWDDCPLRSRYKSRSWKDCTKKRKQWM